MALAWGVAALTAERFLNRVDPVPLPEVSEAARALHADALVADLHADTLLWGRDPLRRSGAGHVDLPRLREGGVGLQAFTVVTRVPWSANMERTENTGPDSVTLLACARLSPMCWRSHFGRLRDQAERLAAAIEADPKLRWVRSREDLEGLLRAREDDPRVVGALLGVEGAHALDDAPENLERAFALGVRMIGLAHFFDNAYAGSAHGMAKGGLTPLGRDIFARMEALGIVADLAHLSPEAVSELLALATLPVVVSHGGAKGTCPGTRTLSDDQLRAIAAVGGVVGIGFWDDAVCGTAPADIARAIAYVARRTGPEHVALGSDYDGAVTVGFDASALPAVTQALLDEGFSDDEVRMILGGNVLRVLGAVLP